MAVSNSDTSSQLMIPSSERHDTGIYTIIVKNMVGQETSSVEIRITGNAYPYKKLKLNHCHSFQCRFESTFFTMTAFCFTNHTNQLIKKITVCWMLNSVFK